MLSYVVFINNNKSYSSETYTLSTAAVIRAETYKIIAQNRYYQIIVNTDGVFQELRFNRKKQNYTLLNYEPTKANLAYLQRNHSYLRKISIIPTTPVQSSRASSPLPNRTSLNSISASSSPVIFTPSRSSSPELIQPNLFNRKRSRSPISTTSHDSDTEPIIEPSPLPIQPVSSDYDY